MHSNTPKKLFKISFAAALLGLSACDQVVDPVWDNPKDPDGTNYIYKGITVGTRIAFKFSNITADWTDESTVQAACSNCRRMYFSKGYLNTGGIDFQIESIYGAYATTTEYPSLYFPLSAIKALPNAGNVYDFRDGKTYETIQIGSQTWFAQNLNYATASGSWCYENSSDSCTKYGRLYNWTTVLGTSSAYLISSRNGTDSYQQGICPSGWHIPNHTEWYQLWLQLTAGSEGDQLKAYSGWGTSDAGTDSVSFHARPSGLRFPGGTFDSSGTGAFFWTSTEESDSTAEAWCLRANISTFKSQSNFYKTDGYSIRCIKN